MKAAFSESQNELLAASRLSIRTVLALQDGFARMFRAYSQRPAGWIPLLATYEPEQATLRFMRRDSAGSMTMPAEGIEFERALALIRELSATMRSGTRADGSLSPVGARARLLWTMIVDEAHCMADGMADDPVVEVLKNAVRVHCLIQFGIERRSDQVGLAAMILKVQERFGADEAWTPPG